MLFLFSLLGLILTTCASDSPIIGILSQETISIQKIFQDNEHFDGYIAASYVKFLESAGARVLPVWIKQDSDYYKRVVENTNGLLLPGGATYFEEPEGYGQAAKELYKWATKSNDEGEYYPILGICLGMQGIIYATLGKDVRINCSASDVALPLNFVDGYKESKIFESISSELVDIFSTKNVTYNQHIFCLTEKNLKENNLSSDWKILTTNVDTESTSYISTMENTKYPYYGLQYHPEKNPYEFPKNHKNKNEIKVKNKNIPKSTDGIKLTNYFATFFVNECRKSEHHVSDALDVENILIYNYVPTYTAKRNSSYEQLYLFTTEDFQNNLLLPVVNAASINNKNLINYFSYLIMTIIFYNIFSD